MAAPYEQPAWIEVAVEVAGIDSELAADLLRQACPGGVAIEAPSRLDAETDSYVLDGDAPALVKGYLPGGHDAARLQQSMKLALQAAPLQRPPVWQEPKPLAEADWRDSWKRYFGVQHIGSGVVIVPGWVDYDARPGETLVRIDPGMAFGTGQHPTTAMCLAALEQLVRPGASVLDLGCGSGILAIAAAKLGAGRVVALDVDPQAAKAAAANAAANAADVEVRTGSLVDASERYDLIVANISGLALERLAPLIAAALTPGGRLVASGFLDDRIGGLSADFEAAGLTVERVMESTPGDWRAIIARRRQ